MTPEQRAEIESRLDGRLEELSRTRIAMRRAAEGSRDSEPAHLDNHPGDIGTELHDEELDQTAEILFEEEERRIDEARRALAKGTYGICMVCGRQIEPQRLAAVPEAVRCIDDQRHFESLHRQRTRI